jgi:hypothetical protein
MERARRCRRLVETVTSCMPMSSTSEGMGASATRDALERVWLPPAEVEVEVEADWNADRLGTLVVSARTRVGPGNLSPAPAPASITAYDDDETLD